MIRVHQIKCWPEYFQLLWIGTKTFEIRINDRNYEIGDLLEIREWNPNTQIYTGKELIKRITYLIQGTFGLPENICVMQLGKVEGQDDRG